MSTRKLLLADDSITIQKVVNLTFADEGIEVITVGNGDSAMEKMAETAPDLVMADVNMPGLNGYQVCEKIKQDENFRQTPVILLVGSFEPFDEEEARRVGADDFLTKPFQSIRQLVSKVTVLLDAGDKSATQLYETTSNDSFADTLDMETPEISDSDQANDLGDAGMDDEMIQTNSVNSFALDESAKFETKEVAEPIDDLGKTQPLSVYDLKEFSFVAENSEADTPFTENKIEDTPEFQSYEERYSTAGDVWETPNKSYPAFSNSDEEDDLLEIPFAEEDDDEAQKEAVEQIPQISPSETEERQEADEIEETKFNEDDEKISASQFSEENETPQAIEAEDQSAAQEYHGENEIVVGTLIEPDVEENNAEAAENQEATEVSTQFSPELIDAIAQKVIEKLSDQVVREIAWEVVPQHADLVIKKMVEEKLKE